MNETITREMDHYVVRDENGNFICSADTYEEAKAEIGGLYESI